MEFASNSPKVVCQPPRDAFIAPSHCAQLPAKEPCSFWVGNEILDGEPAGGIVADEIETHVLGNLASSVLSNRRQIG